MDGAETRALRYVNTRAIDYDTVRTVHVTELRQKRTSLAG